MDDFDPDSLSPEDRAKLIEVGIDPERLTPENREKLNKEDYRAIANERRAVILGWAMIAIGFPASLILTHLQINPVILWRPAGLLLVVTILLIYFHEHLESPKPLLICGALWMLIAVTMAVLNYYGLYLVVE